MFYQPRPASMGRGLAHAVPGTTGRFGRTPVAQGVPLKGPELAIHGLLRATRRLAVCESRTPPHRAQPHASNLRGWMGQNGCSCKKLMR